MFRTLVNQFIEQNFDIVSGRITFVFLNIFIISPCVEFGSGHASSKRLHEFAHKLRLLIFCIVSAILAPWFSMLSILWSNVYALSFSSSSSRLCSSGRLRTFLFNFLSLLVCFAALPFALISCRRDLFRLCNFRFAALFIILISRLGFPSKQCASRLLNPFCQ